MRSFGRVVRDIVSRELKLATERERESSGEKWRTFTSDARLCVIVCRSVSFTQFEDDKPFTFLCDEMRRHLLTFAESTHKLYSAYTHTARRHWTSTAIKVRIRVVALRYVTYAANRLFTQLYSKRLLPFSTLNAPRSVFGKHSRSKCFESISTIIIVISC